MRCIVFTLYFYYKESYIDFYPAVTLPDGKTTSTENLRFSIHEKPWSWEQKTSHRVREEQLAESIRAHRQLEIQTNAYGYGAEKSGLTLGRYMETQAAGERTPQTGKQWGFMIRHLRLCGIDNVLLLKVDVPLCLRFRGYLQGIIDRDEIGLHAAGNYLSSYRAGLRQACQAGPVNDNLCERFDRFPEELKLPFGHRILQVGGLNAINLSDSGANPSFRPPFSDLKNLLYTTRCEERHAGIGDCTRKPGSSLFMEGAA